MLKLHKITEYGGYVLFWDHPTTHIDFYTMIHHRDRIKYTLCEVVTNNPIKLKMIMNKHGISN
jgi:hypothetical protein